MVAPYQYRIDWQMWFAAMSDYRHHPWIVNLVYKLLSGDHAVSGLLANNPFPNHPPKYIRADLYRYELTTWNERQSGWWKRNQGAPLPPAPLPPTTTLCCSSWIGTAGCRNVVAPRLAISEPPRRQDAKFFLVQDGLGK